MFISRKRQETQVEKYPTPSRATEEASTKYFDGLCGL